MKGFIAHIEQETLQNDSFRKVLYTTENTQLVVMSLKPGEEIGEEVHQLDQFIRVESGTAKTLLDGVEGELKPGDSVTVPQGTKHNIINTGGDYLKLYTVYAPPNHRRDVVHRTKEAAEADDEHFDGVTDE
jgi:mannose-6-phosphate isomerase-like protein (cupin superfamily)